MSSREHWPCVAFSIALEDTALAYPKVIVPGVPVALPLLPMRAAGRSVDLWIIGVRFQLSHRAKPWDNRGQKNWNLTPIPPPPIFPAGVFEQPASFPILL